MRRTHNSEEEKRIIMDIDVVLKSHDCKFIVQCLGCFIKESDVWICMELMTTCFDKLTKKSNQPVPEPILGKITVAVSTIDWRWSGAKHRILIEFFFVISDGERVVISQE